MLEVFLLTVLLGTVTAMVSIGVGLGLALRAVAERSRLHPSIETGAPLSWGWSPFPPARVHRRLQAAVGAIYTRAPGDDSAALADGTADLITLIAQQAADVDRELIAAGRLVGPHRRVKMRRLRKDVRRIEQLSLRLQYHRSAIAAGAIGRPASRDEVLDQVHSRLGLLADAHAELVQIEQAGLASDPDALLARITRAQPVPAEGRSNTGS